MKVFLSWSGDRSKAVASALNDLLPSILQPVTCWMSEGGIAKGKPWFDQLAKELNAIVFGVFCVTPENKDSEWLLWEAGFLSSSTAVGERHVAPLAIGMSKGSLAGPLSIYQGTDTNKEDLFRLVREINNAVTEEKRVPVATLRKTYEYVWPDLEQRIAAAQSIRVNAPVVAKPSTNDQLDQVVALLREGQRETANLQAQMLQLSQTVDIAANTGLIGRSPIYATPSSRTIFGVGLGAGTPLNSLLDMHVEKPAGLGGLFQDPTTVQVNAPAVMMKSPKQNPK
jgi:hypothetical protein